MSDPNAHATPAGEDRLLDLGEIERAVEKFGFTEATDLDSDGDDLGRTRIYCRGGWFTIPTREKDFVAHAPDWLARLCARVRELKATNQRLNRRCHDYERGLAVKIEEVQRAGPSLGRALSGAAYAMEKAKREAAEAASQRLTEAHAKELEAAKMLCDIYFSIAESCIPAEEISRRRDAAVARTVRDLQAARGGADAPPAAGR